jgi:anti-sigma regulatory factor (Ser/Thr protein kinase)
MAQHQKSGSLSFPASTEHLAELGQFIQTLCEPHPQVTLLELAITEAITNVIKHGEATTCRVHICHLYQTYQVTVEDNGKMFNAALSTPKPMGELREGGYGLAIINKVAENLSYRYVQGWNQLTLTFPESV